MLGASEAESDGRGLTKKARLESSVVKIDGRKLRAGTVPWRCGISETDGTDCLQVLLIEGVNTPGKWTFPAGSLDPGEEVSTCAARETQEECGASGSLGCFLGTFDTEKNRTYMFLMHVQHMEDESNEAWHDPHSAYESSLRRRRWFHVSEAKPLLKKDGPQMLEAFLSVPKGRRQDARCRSHRSVCQPPRPRLLVLGGPGTLRDYLAQNDILKASFELSSELSAGSFTDGQLFAAVAASLWEVDAAVFCGGTDALYMAGLSARQDLPTLVIITGQNRAPRLFNGDSRITSFTMGSDSEVILTTEACRRIDDFMKQLHADQALPAV
ncbi:Nudt3 [Symbiodinium natans]|uniref:Nudt3 protein n=1 Tax=Symbiodinium natans TaxID=878477 RepID=A0A812RY70_9DINO|nr:Nudt3 [Symbiodinium natans]